MRAITDSGHPDDVDQAVAARLARSRCLYEGGHRFVVLLEEWVPRRLPGHVDGRAVFNTLLLGCQSLREGRRGSWRPLN
jgi:hypothetical protein